MHLQNGRPENTDGRLDKEIRVYDFLDKLGVEYQRVDHEAAMTMEACEAIDRVLGDDTAICTNLLRPRISPHRSVLPDYPSPNRNIWKNIWTSHPGLSVSLVL